MLIRLGDHVECRHVRPLTEETAWEDFRTIARGGTPKFYNTTVLLMDKPEVTCPDCGKVWTVNDK